MPDYTFSFSGNLYSDLARFVEDPISRLADKERDAERHAKLNKIASQPIETTHSPLLSTSIFSTETDNVVNSFLAD